MIEPLVLLPGFMNDAGVFHPQLARFSRARAVTVAPVSCGERIEEIASNLLDQLPHRFALAGFDLGGGVALDLVRRAPDRVTRLCLIAVDAQADTPHIAAGREELIVGAQAGRLGDMMRSIVGSDVLAPGPQRISILQEILEMAETQGTDVFVRQMRALQRRPDQQATLGQIKVPTLILGGAHDCLVPSRKQSFMADLLPNSELCVIDNAGHFPTLETPGAVNAAMSEWLEKPLRDS